MRDVGIGALLGLFLGLLIGLSASEVVAGVASGLVALLGALFGLRSEAAPGPLPGGNGARVAGFAAAGILAVLLGLAARTHGWLEPSPAETRERWVAAGFTAENARALTAFRHLGLVPAGRTAGEAKTANARTGALFANPGDNAACDALTARRYETASALAGAMRAEGGVWERLADRIGVGLDNGARHLALQASVAALCQEP